MTTAQPPRLHMGCGEALRSRWLLNPGRAERDCVRQPKPAKRKPERARR